MLKVSGITLWRSDRVIFNKLSFQLLGRRTGLIGPNGAGKSSLLKLLQGLITPSEGVIDLSFEGEGSVTPRSGPLRCGLVFQSPQQQILFPTVMEELCFGRLEQGESKKDAQAYVSELAQRYNASDLLRLATHELSEGQKQLICILSVLADGPDILLFDEPFSGLDLATTQQMMRLLHALPAPILMATHNLELLHDFDEVIWLEAGHIRAQGDPKTVTLAYRSEVSEEEQADKNIASP